MAEKATKKLHGLQKQNFASELRKQKLDKDKADTKPFDDDEDEDFLDSDCQNMYYDTAEDADDEIDSKDDYEVIRPLNIKKARPGKDSDQGMQCSPLNSMSLAGKCRCRENQG